MHWALCALCGLGETGAFVLVGKRKAVWRGMALQGYEIRLFDKRIASFTFETNCFGESCAVGLRVEPGAEELLPLNLVGCSNDIELRRFLDSRRIPKNRAYIERILAPFGLQASDTKGIIDVTKGMSLNDSYCVVPADEDPCFAEYNLFSNSFDTVLSIIAYTGRIPSSQVGSGIPSELSPSGSFPKTWRVVNGQRVLYKAAHDDGLGLEPVSEYLASQVAVAMGLLHVAYDLDVWQERLCSTCVLMNDAESSFVPFAYMLDRDAKDGMNLERALAFFDELGEEAGQRFRSMLVFDAVVMNPDRHMGNYGVLRDNRTGRVLGFAPIFDNNLALLPQYGTESLSEELLRERFAATPGAFGPTAYQQACAALGPQQRERLERLHDFAFDDAALARVGRQRDGFAFPKQRLLALGQAVRENAAALLKV